MGAALVIEARFTSYFTGEAESDSVEFAECDTFDAAALLALACNEDGAVDWENTEPDFPGDTRRRVVTFYAVDKAEWEAVLEAERREREDALLPFGEEWYREQTERW
jgi:hypothetical protein